MDEKLRGRGIWIALGALALIFLCVALVGLAAMAAFVPARTVGYAVAPQAQVPQVQAPPAGEGSAVTAPTYVYPARPWYGAWGPFSFVGFGISLIVRLFIFGLLFVLFFRIVRRILWGRRWGYGYWGPHGGGRSPEDKEGQDAPASGPGPWGWRHHRHWGPPPWWGQEPPKTGPADKPDAPETGYTGPQE